MGRTAHVNAMKRRILLLSTLTVTPTAWAQAPRPAQAPPPVIDGAAVQRVETYLNAMRTLRARFLQIAQNGASAEGLAWISRPGRMRSSAAPAPPVRTGLGPPAAPDALGTGSPFIGGNRSTSASSSANLPAEAQAVPTIAQAILAARQAPAEPDSTGRLAKASPLARSFLVLKPSLGGDTAMLPAKQNLK